MRGGQDIVDSYDTFDERYVLSLQIAHSTTV